MAVLEQSWIKVQEKTFGKWCVCLVLGEERRGRNVECFETDTMTNALPTG
jgi:hypothetical protein